jgi:hypothetical protein
MSGVNTPRSAHVANRCQRWGGSDQGADHGKNENGETTTHFGPP